MNSLLKQIGRSAWGLLPEVATDSTKIDTDTLSPLHAQFYENGEDRRLYFNINGSISYISLANSTKGSTDVATTIPAGIICMWSGTIATIPSGWNLCDGSNGTPDLRDKFIVCATQDDSGIAKSNVTGSLAQSGNGQLPATDTDNESSHTHQEHAGGGYVYVKAGAGGNIAFTTTTTDQTGGIEVTEAGSAHKHSFGTGTKNIAVFYALAYIQKL